MGNRKATFRSISSTEQDNKTAYPEEHCHEWTVATDPEVEIESVSNKWIQEGNAWRKRHVNE